MKKILSLLSLLMLCIVGVNAETFAMYALSEGETSTSVYTVAGNAPFFGETAWTISEANDLTKGDDGIYTKTYSGVELTNGTKIMYKVVKNHDWTENWGNPNGTDGNADYTVWEGDGTYDVTFKFNSDGTFSDGLHVACEMTKQPTPITAMAIMGNLPGLSWDLDGAVAMTTEDNNNWTATLENVELPAGDYYCKAIANGNWEDLVLPGKGDNDAYTLKITESGIYNIVFTVDLTKPELTVEPTKVGELADIYSLVGGFYGASEVNIFGGNQLWDYENTASEMTLDELTGLYTWTSDEIELETGRISYQVAKNHSWETQWGYPDNNDHGNAFFDITTAGKYTLTFTFSPTEAIDGDYHVKCTAVKAEEPAPEITSMTIVGEFIGGEPTEEETEPWWNPANGWAMTQDAENPAVWTLTKEFEAEAKTYKYKATANGKYGDYELPAEGDQNFVFGTDEYPAGKYNLTFTANTEEHTLTLVPERKIEPVEPYEVTFNFSDPNIRENIGESMTDTKGYIYNETFTAEGATLQITSGSAASRIYVDNKRGQNLVTYKEYTTLTFRAPEGKAITKIEFTAAGSSNINNFTASSGTIEDMTWTGNADGVRFQQGGTSYLANAVVTLEAAGEATAILPAIEYTDCENIAAFNALEPGTYARITLTDAEIIGKSADGYSTVWVQDATAGAWIQYTSLNDKLNEMTKINGAVFTIKRAASGNPQLKEAEGTIDSKFSAEAIDAYTIVEGTTISEVNVPENLNKVVKISGATLNMTSASAGKLTLGEETIDVNNGGETANQQLHKIAEWEKDKVLENITITAILVAKSATANQLLPISIEQPVVIESMAIVGDFLGLEATDEDANPNWNPANGWAMTQSVENPAMWTLTKEFEAKAKTYYYKATANGNWDDYVLPNGDNADFVFGTETYPAGKYNLTFTANTEEHKLTLDVEKVVNPDEPQLLVLPDGVELATYTLTSTTTQYIDGVKTEGIPYETTVQVGFMDDKMYIQGLNPDNKDAWVYGIVSENKVSIPKDQLINLNPSQWLRFFKDVLLDEFVLSYDSEKGEFTNASDKACISYRLEYAPEWQFMYVGMTLTAPVVVEPEYYLVGTMNEWTSAEEYKLVANAETEGEYMITLDFEAGAEFQIVNGETWYPGGEQNNCTINEAGNYTVYFRPDYNGGDDWFHKCIYVVRTIEPIKPAIADGTYYVVSAAYYEPTLVIANGETVKEDGYPLTFTFDAEKGGYTVTGNDFMAGKQWVVENDPVYGHEIYTMVDGAKKYLAVENEWTNKLTFTEDGTADNAGWAFVLPDYWENDVMSYNVAGTADLCAAEWDMKTNKMSKNAETGLFTWTKENITVSNDVKPEFKVAASNDGVGVWYPLSDDEGDHNWVITPDYLGAEGIYTITITFDAATKVIGVVGEKTGEIEPEYALGDANLDGEVTTSDAVLAVSFALETEVPTKAQFKAANVIGDDAITVADAVAIVNIALEKDPEPVPDDEPTGARMLTGCNYLTMNGQTVNLTNDIDFAGFQMDVTLADGALLNGVELTERASGMMLGYNRISDNTWRIVALSLDNKTISGNSGELLKLDIMGNSTIGVTNVEFADTAARAYRLDVNGEATGISGIYGVNSDADIYNVNGVRTNTMQKGVNIIRNSNGKVQKVFVK